MYADYTIKPCSQEKRKTYLDENGNYTATVIWCVSRTFKYRSFTVCNYTTPVKTNNGVLCESKYLH